VYPDYYVLVNLWSFSEIIDNLGGIDVDVGATMTDHRDNYGDYTVNPGTVHMDGETTLWYVRARYATDDFDRGRRQQEVLEAMGLKLLSLNALTHASDFYTIYRKSVTTDLTLDNIVSWIPLATQLSDTSRIHRYQIGTHQVYNWITYAGAMVLIPIRESVLEVMLQALNSP
jgi:anionic cell wall polymer biosynthesis LytR-Cps2A-Psr (LCP) family protein